MSKFDSLPHDCIALILSFTSPGDICRSSAVSRSVLAAAVSDSAWEKFLPTDYDRLRSAASSPPPPLRKKDAYLDLCNNPLLLEGGLMSLSLERCSGKTCFMIGSRSLSIIWEHNNQEFWTWSSNHASRFSEVAELKLVCWLEISGKIDTQLLSPNTNYAAYFVFKFNEQNFGFENLPVEVSLGFGCRGGGSHNVFMDPDGKIREKIRVAQQKLPHLVRIAREKKLDIAKQLPSAREDGWMEVEMGEFFRGSDGSGEVAVKLMEVKKLNEKSGLVIQGIEFRPKKVTFRV